MLGSVLRRLTSESMEIARRFVGDFATISAPGLQVRKQAKTVLLRKDTVAIHTDTKVRLVGSMQISESGKVGSSG